jgi:hypothetical protein
MGWRVGVTFSPQMWISRRMQIVQEFKWHRLARALNYTPDDDSEDRVAFNLTGLEGGWSPPFVPFPANLPEFHMRLRLRGVPLNLQMTGVSGFTDSSSGSFPWEVVQKGEIRWPNIESSQACPLASFS